MYKIDCTRCDGKKNISAFRHVHGGTCFKCGGVGYTTRKTKPRLSKTFKTGFLWLNPNDVNYNNGDFCMCGNIKARSYKEAVRKTRESMKKNGSSDFIVKEV